MAHIHAEPASGEATEDKTLGQLVTSAERDIVHLVRSEIELAKAEITADVKRGGMGGGLLGGAGFFGYVALLFLSIAAALALGLVLPVAAGFAIVGALYVLAAAVLALAGMSNFKKLNKVRRTKKTFQDTMTLVKRGQGEQSEQVQARS